MLKLKAPLIIAGTTCVLSMLIGLISGVRFLHILGRGLIAGVGAGSFVFCTRILLERFIPDLFTPSPAVSDTAETTDSSSGSNINITLDDDLGVAAPVMAGGNAETAATAKLSGTQAESESTETFPVDAASDSSDNDTVHEASGASDASSFSFGGSSQDDSGLSDLPNMGSFIDDDFDESVDDSVQTDSSGFSMTGIQTGGTDSKVMAQAIRTVLATED